MMVLQNISIGKEFGFVTLQPANGEDWREKLEKAPIII